MKNSLKSKIRYWFLFLRLAHDFKDTMVTRNLKNSESLYSSWGNYQTESFENWWKKHSNLFREVSTVRVLNSKDSVTESDFVISIPYTLSPTAVGKMVASMYRKRQSERLTEKQPKSGKTKKVYKGEFTLTSPEYQVAQFAYYYKFAKEVYVHLRNTRDREGDRVRNRDYLFKAKEVFGKLNRKATEVRDIPFTKVGQSNDAENKQIRRYVQYASQLLQNVSLGVFPGDYELKPRKSLVQLKKELSEKRSLEGQKVKKTRRARHSTDMKIIKRSNPFDPHSDRKQRKDAGIKRKKAD